MAIQSKIKFTQQKPLTMALKFITDNLHLKGQYLEAAHGLNRCTLCKIRKGEEIPRVYDHYMRVFIGILNAHRIACLEASQDTAAPMRAKRCELTANRITMLLRDMLLVEYFFPTDNEIKPQKTFCV
ncbi:MAG: hypothetical protein MJZ29_12385 [Bacteroidaceae bacterium]|nr:hypothetical protein [Bacteroidaceae bacterium]